MGWLDGKRALVAGAGSGIGIDALVNCAGIFDFYCGLDTIVHSDGGIAAS